VRGHGLNHEFGSGFASSLSLFLEYPGAGFYLSSGDGDDAG
jgi:hypothetical protein